MPTIAEIRSQYPQYQDLTDQQLGDALYTKFYSDMPRSDFDAKVGLDAAPVQEEKGWLRTADDFVRGAADMMTFGLSDEISAGLSSMTGIGGKSGDYDANLAAQRQRDSEGGGARLAGQIGGALVLPGAAARTVPGAFGIGAATGAGYGYGSGEGGIRNRIENAAVTAAIGGTAGAAVRGGINALQTRAASKTIPTMERLREAGQAAYKAADEAGVMFSANAANKLSTRIVDDLAELGYDPALQPGAKAVLDRLGTIQGQNVTLKGLESIRRVASNGFVPGNKGNNKVVSKLIERIDELVEKPAAGDIIMGDARAGMKALAQARNAWSRLSKNERLLSAVEQGERRAASTGSGGNTDNAIRQNVRRIVEKPRGLTGPELKMAERVVRGTTGQNALRLAGKLAPTGVVSGVLSGGAGYGLAGPVGLALPLVGEAAKRAADAMTKKNVERLSQMIRSGGKTGQEIAKLARGGQLSVPEVQRLEGLAKMLGTSVPAIAAVAADTLAKVAR